MVGHCQLELEVEDQLLGQHGGQQQVQPAGQQQGRHGGQQLEPGDQEGGENPWVELGALAGAHQHHMGPGVEVQVVLCWEWPSWVVAGMKPLGVGPRVEQD